MVVLAQPPYFSWARCNHGGSAHSTVAIADYDPVERGVVVALDLKKCDIKCLDDDDKGICRSFFPPMFGEDGANSGSGADEEACQYVDKVATHNKF